MASADCNCDYRTQIEKCKVSEHEEFVKNCGDPSIHS